ncbi:carbamoyltransferase C-terminal domain-containing protein [Paenibacillus sp. NPDC058071]|uniref:carbamoyltransferase C-terminal domain-containing protein n=1 Tax=Paenibacillus sp. NPDC058071 TaxID=3346326 RepID=UPI0036DDD2F9
MRDGYYLSTFLYIDELACAMDIKMRHNQNASLWKKNGSDLSLVRYWELERVTGFKQHSITFLNKEKAIELINYLLNEFGLTIEDMNEVWGTPLLDTTDRYTSIKEYSDIAYHSVAHLYSSVLLQSDIFYNSTIIGLAVDSGPDNVVDQFAYEKRFYAGCVVNQGKIEVFPVHSPGKLWSRAKKQFKLREGTLMALATATTAELRPRALSTLNLMDMSARDEAKAFLDDLIEIAADRSNLLYADERFSEEENRISAIMKEVQKMSDLIMESNIHAIRDKYNISVENSYLALSGGYALNCPTNSHLMKKFKFKGLLAPPCVNDSGMSLGMALYSFYKNMNGEVNVTINHAYHGIEDSKLDEIAASDLYRPYVKSIQTISFEQAVEDLIDQPIVWFCGKAELGPRALGNRSILADPRSVRSKDRLNVVKKRQWWRPVAPIVLESYGHEFFEDFNASPFMLQNFQIRKEKLELIPAVAHLDGTARIQTVNQEHDNKLLYQLLESFYSKTNVPILCNTSLNDNEEPIINTIEEALNFALRKGFDVIYVNGQRIALHNHHLYEVQKPLKRRTEECSELTESAKEEIISRLNPHKVEQDVLIYYYDHPELMDKYSLLHQEQADRIRTIAREYIARFPMSFVRN